ncbi:hypothetical protein ACLX1H_008830 [Fusarium chlamydosporum]
MAPQTFHLFCKLPLNVRCYIYLLATPPRAVWLHSRTETFSEFLDSGVLHESLERKRQLLSEYYSRMAYFTFRKSYFYTPENQVPVLLHTCRESRDALIRHGYELTFRTTTSGPRIWFNYGRDALMFPEYYMSSFMLNCSSRVEEPGFLCLMVPEDKKRLRFIVEKSRWWNDKNQWRYIDKPENKEKLSRFIRTDSLTWWSRAISNDPDKSKVTST